MDTNQMPEWAIKLQENQKRQEDEIAKLEKENVMLKEITGKTKMENWKDSKKDHTMKTAELKVRKGKPIVKWSDLDDSKADFHASTAKANNLFTTVTYRDGTEEEMNYHTFSSAIQDRIKVKLVAFGPTDSKIEFEDGEQIKIKTCFLNA